MPAQSGALRRHVIVALLSLGIGAVGGSCAAEEVVDVTIDFARVMKFDQPFSDIIVGNPGIANVTDRDKTSFVLTGKAAGTTNLIVLNEAGDEMANTTVRVSPNVQRLTTVYYGKERRTFSCTPTCEQVLSVGDDSTAFKDANEQIQSRQEFSGAE